MVHHEIVLPYTKPETEWVHGRALQKASPKRTHSFLQGAMTIELTRWAAGRGGVGPEWRSRVAPPGEIRRPLVPDVAYVSKARLRASSDEDLEVPPFAPDVAVEILSPDDRRSFSLVIVVDPQKRFVELHDPLATECLAENAAIEHAALPGFRYPVRDLFAVLRRP
ncbi:MAG TPA: Uma2 family endonuclease [Candidatus Cybelea sp.]|jgi:Uma2 family endonuclease|nr:Uma2 family endonuclease [Candidatus Cybelea sp.]